ncbi:MAG TPA: type II secretion system protein GspG [Chitinophagaceae bacterium]|nr:type II secretion system protein GspG [Chitinophagaceae bacterium]
MYPPPPIYKPRPPYLLGLLCLIPLLGAIAGIVLLILGITKYKDKWMIMIGAFGILFTVGIYSFLFYFMRYSELSRKGFAELSQMNLNSLVSHIEFYKLQHGHYPDNLQQLADKNKVIFMFDPIQGAQGRKNDSYYYKRIDEKYTLFSSGQDGIPNNSDDLYPQISIDSSQSPIGLILPN